MPPQEILFNVSIVLFGLAAVSFILAAVLFFTRNIPDVYADLTGKKRAEAASQRGTGRAGGRRMVARHEPTSGALAAAAARKRETEPTGEVAAPAPVPVENPAVQSVPAQSTQGAKPASRQSVVWEKASASEGDTATAILPEDNAATTILPEDDSATVILADDTDETVIIGAKEEPVEQPAEEPVEEFDVQPERKPAEELATAASAAAAALDIAPEGQPITASPVEFTVVRKVVLMESDRIIQIQQGADHEQ